MKNSTQAGFTRTELAAATAALALLGALAAPILATTRSDSERASCFNNLRQIGRGVHQFAAEHQNRAPWLTPIDEGGTYSNPKPGNSYEEYFALTNELGSPKILACPADSQVVVAPDWLSYYSDPAFQGGATSYSIGLHPNSERPRSLLAADYNIRASAKGGPCTSGINNVLAYFDNDPLVRWLDNLHNNAGHLLLNDGSVLFTDSATMRKTFAEPSASDNSQTHMVGGR